MLYIPTLHEIESLSVGDMALNCFGQEAKVTQVTHRGTDIYGKAYVLYFTATATGNGEMSMSMREDELVRHVGTSKYFNSWQLDDIEKDMLAKGERVREL